MIAGVDLTYWFMFPVAIAIAGLAGGAVPPADGRALLVDRGWVPMDRRDPATRLDGQRGGTVTLEGLLRTGGWKGAALFRPDNDPEKNVWVWFDLPAMAATAGLAAPVTALYLEAGPAENPGGLPKGGQTPIHLRNDHLQYAITWYGLAAALIAVFAAFAVSRWRHPDA